MSHTTHSQIDLFCSTVTLKIRTRSPKANQVFIIPQCYIHQNLVPIPKYCKLGNFRENFIFANSVKRHICYGKNSRLGPDLPTSVNDRVIWPFHEGFMFTKLRRWEVLQK